MEGETEENVEIYINGMKYSYLLYKSEKDKEKLIIKLCDSKNKTNIYYTCEGDMNKLKKILNF